MYHHNEPKYHVPAPAPYAIDCGRAHVAAWRQYQFIKNMRAMAATRWWEG